MSAVAAWVVPALREAMEWGEGQLDRDRSAILWQHAQVRELILAAERRLQDTLAEDPVARRRLDAEFDALLEAHDDVAEAIAGLHAGAPMDRVRALVSDLQLS